MCENALKWYDSVRKWGESRVKMGGVWGGNGMILGRKWGESRVRMGGIWGNRIIGRRGHVPIWPESVTKRQFSLIES
jgi:hypothetical protein